MKLLITPAEVAERCFGGDGNIAREFIGEAVILAAQQDYIRPVIGQCLWREIDGGGHVQLVEGYIKPALALYVKKLVLPELAAQPGIMGVVSYSGQGFGDAGGSAIANLAKSIHKQANALMRVCMEHINTFPGLYPGYEPEDNIKNRVSIEGGVVI